jgi:hypothetical protein
LIWTRSTRECERRVEHRGVSGELELLGMPLREPMELAQKQPRALSRAVRRRVDEARIAPRDEHERPQPASRTAHEVQLPGPHLA